MAWLAPLLGLLKALLGVFRENQIRTEAKGLQAATDAATAATETVHEIATANDAGDAVERDLREHPDRVFAPDKYARD